MRLEPPVDGMSWLTAHLPAAAAIAAYEHLDQLAHALPVDIDGVIDPRNMDAKRADVLVDLLFGTSIRPDGTLQTPAPINVHVIVDGRQGTVADDGLPGEIAGLGPVTADTLRDLLDLTDHTAGTVDGAVASRPALPRSRHPPS